MAGDPSGARCQLLCGSSSSKTLWLFWRRNVRWPPISVNAGRKLRGLRPAISAQYSAVVDTISSASWRQFAPQIADREGNHPQDQSERKRTNSDPTHQRPTPPPRIIDRSHQAFSIHRGPRK
jgi:hypothetical protein